MATLTPRLVTGAPMLLAGTRKVHPIDKAFETIPAQWVAFAAMMGQIPDRVPGAQFGIVCGATANESLEYMCAVEVRSFDNFPDGMGRLKVPSADYAVFAHAGTAADVAQSWRAIWQDWLPPSGYEAAETPDFERYDDQYDPQTGAGGIEIWFPVVRTSV